MLRRLTFWITHIQWNGTMDPFFRDVMMAGRGRTLVRPSTLQVCAAVLEYVTANRKGSKKAKKRLERRLEKRGRTPRKKTSRRGQTETNLRQSH